MWLEAVLSRTGAIDLPAQSFFFDIRFSEIPWAVLEGFLCLGRNECRRAEGMDPITALGIAGNVVQFIDFGLKAVSKAREIHSSSTGALRVNVDLEV